MVLVRTVMGEQLRRRRQAKQWTLRQVSKRAQVSLGYLSEVERGHKEPSSELLASICEALDVRLSTVLYEAGEDMRRAELVSAGPARLIEVPLAALSMSNVVPELTTGVPVDRAA
jgi:transcriptional regulator with XRE-family HTH domain